MAGITSTAIGNSGVDVALLERDDDVGVATRDLMMRVSLDLVECCLRVVRELPDCRYRPNGVCTAIPRSKVK
jgi:hypothetical protein